MTDDQKPKQYLTQLVDDAVNIARIGIEFGRVVEDAQGHPMDVSTMDRLLEEMKPYREIFEPMVTASREELNKRHPMMGMDKGKPRFDYQIPQ